MVDARQRAGQHALQDS